MHKMQQSSPWIPKNEPRPGITHNCGNFLPSLPSVAMNRAFGTYRFFPAKKTFFQSLLCICQQRLTGRAKSGFRLMLPPTIHTNHFLKCFSLLPNSSAHRPTPLSAVILYGAAFIIKKLSQKKDDKKHKTAPKGCFFMRLNKADDMLNNERYTGYDKPAEQTQQNRAQTIFNQ